MQIKEYIQVDEALMSNLVALENRAQAQDETHRDVYLSNQYHVDKSMPWVVTAWKEDRLVGFLAMYADNLEDVEVSVVVDPDLRSQGISSALMEAAESIKQKYKIEEFTYVMEEVMLSAYPFFTDKYRIEADGTEYIMEAEGIDSTCQLSDQMSVRLATGDDVVAVTWVQSAAFESDESEAHTYAYESIHGGEDYRVYVFLQDGKVVGSTSVNITPDYYYFFGLAVHPDFMGQGIASQGIGAVMRDLYQHEPMKFRLAVAKDNPIACRLYRNNGFEVVTQVNYLKRRKGR